MKPRINVITLAVNDLDKSVAFYRDGLGLPSQGILGTEFRGTATEPAGAIGLFQLQNGLILSLYPRSELAKDSKQPVHASSSVEFSLGYLVESRNAVDELLRKAEEAGATVTDAPHDRAWGIYSGYFLDLDSHLWEIIWNPELEMPNDDR